MERAVQGWFGAFKKSEGITPILISRGPVIDCELFLALKPKTQLNADTYRIVILKA